MKRARRNISYIKYYSKMMFAFTSRTRQKSEKCAWQVMEISIAIYYVKVCATGIFHDGELMWYEMYLMMKQSSSDNIPQVKQYQLLSLDVAVRRCLCRSTHNQCSECFSLFCCAVIKQTYKSVMHDVIVTYIGYIYEKALEKEGKL